MDVDVKPGTLIRWIVDYYIYEAYPDALRPRDPIYRHGIVVGVSEVDPLAVVVYCIDCKDEELVILHMVLDGFEILSKG